MSGLEREERGNVLLRFENYPQRQNALVPEKLEIALAGMRRS